MKRELELRNLLSSLVVLAAASYISSETQLVPPELCTSGTYLPHECNCKLKYLYYECVNGQYVERQCPGGKIFDEKSSRCVTEVRCLPTKYELIPNEANCSLYYECKDGVKTEKRCKNGLSFDAVKQMCSWPPSRHVFNPIIESCDRPQNYQCPEDFTVIPDQDCQCACENCIPRYPDNANCSRYFECENNKKVSKECPPKLAYDPKRQICDYPQNVNCSHPRCNEGEKTHHDCQCNLYYQCENGRQKVVSCPPGLYFDWKDKVCLSPDVVHCYPQGCIGICPSNGTTTLPHDDCHKYCECTEGSSMIVSCDKKQIYDPKQQKCIPPENVKNQTCELFPCDPNSNSTSSMPHECLCDRYYECKKGQKYLVVCPEGKHFDYVQEKCVESKDAHCYKSEPCSNDPDCGDIKCTTDGSTSSHKDCRKYCICRNGHAVTENCPQGLYFDKVSGKCAWPENVDLAKNCQPFNCTDNPIPHDCNCTSYYQCEKGDKYLEKCDGSYFDYVLSKCVNITEDPHCYHHYSKTREVDDCVEHCPKQTSVRPVIHIRHKKCSQYCVCSMGAPYIVNCPDGKEYNERTKSCTSRETAQCQPHLENENKPSLSNFPFVDYL
ncbi:Peritrophin-48 [Melipona quadrifasciata]|uniref:Peritrophin-48 n=1 Tax=Melipona quadrifasciata TaxID=166423 RepID=A0A0N0BCP8_9HYME|nr:Peritrophin-48 [Melipona quadrifasciata]